ncbi:hypothetical protein RFI_08176 [Reticulomyxa filosa]|uniref:5-formyltetrahydrofolate cyclo-ligase n=1 Tax=Reticulomyxa filosa TaxID=46433 RepID=X6NRP3_RETFI|nr:hypothetical protein RFI_08176 [Reticulomyxa filosa]|eukprot:ETO28950.1 hypothetical protein RFI_08176 [Reticulomyxa filosa]
MKGKHTKLFAAMFIQRKCHTSHVKTFSKKALGNISLEKKSVTTHSLDNEEKYFTKEHYRQKVWSHMEHNNIAAFPRPVFHRIPNFVGSKKAAQNLLKISEFVEAKIVKCGPDKAQQYVRVLCLQQNKKLLVPCPQMRHGLFYMIEIPQSRVKEYMSKYGSLDGLYEYASTQKGMNEFGKELSIKDMQTQIKKIDVCIVGSVAVDKNNGNRIGKGKGYADMELAILSEYCQCIDPKSTCVITTVHDCQVFDCLNIQPIDKQQQQQGLRLDYIVTPTKVIRINKDKNDKHIYSIDWNRVTSQQLQSIPILAQLHTLQTKQSVKTNNLDAMSKTQIYTNSNIDNKTNVDTQRWVPKNSILKKQVDRW